MRLNFAAGFGQRIIDHRNVYQKRCFFQDKHFPEPLRSGLSRKDFQQPILASVAFAQGIRGRTHQSQELVNPKLHLNEVAVKRKVALKCQKNSHLTQRKILW